MATDHFQLSPASAEARFQLLQLRRRFNPKADDPLFRPIDADDFRTNGENASDFSNLRQNGLVRITFPLPPNIRLIDPATNLPSRRDVRGRLADRADGQRCRPDRTRRGQCLAARSEPTAATSSMADVTTLQEQALGAFTDHAQVRQRAAAAAARRPVVVSARAVHEPSRTRARRAVRAGTAAARSRSAAQRAGAAGQGRVRARLRAMPRWPRTVDAGTPGRPVVRFHTSQRSVRVRLTPPRLRASFAACPPQLARNARTYEITLAERDARSAGQAPIPGRALLTGFVGVGPSRRTTGTSSTSPAFAGSARPPRTSTTTAPPRSRRWSITTSSSSSAWRRTG